MCPSCEMLLCSLCAWQYETIVSDNAHSKTKRHCVNLSLFQSVCRVDFYTHCDTQEEPDQYERN